MTILQRLLVCCLLLVVSVAGAVQPNATDQTLYFGVLDADGNPGATATINAAISSISLNYKTAPTTAATTTSLTALASATTAHTDNRAYAVAPGLLRVDFPDAPWATGVSSFPAWLTFSGGLSAYSQAGISQTVTLGYGLQSPDSGATALGRQATLPADVFAQFDSEIDTQNDFRAATSLSLASILSKSLKYTQLIVRKDSAIATANATELTAINNSGGSYNNQTDSVEAIRDFDTTIKTDTGTTLPALIGNIEVSSVSADQALQRLRNYTSTVAAGNQSTTSVVLTTLPTTPEAYVGSTIKIGDLTRTITGYEPADAPVPAFYYLNSALSPYPSTGTAVTIYGDPQAALIAYEAATVGDVEGVSAPVPAITSRVHKPNRIPFGTMADGWYKSKRPIRVAVGSSPVVAADMSEWGDMDWQGMDAPTTSDATVASPGSVANDTYGISTKTGTPSFELVPDDGATAGDTCVITVQATADGQPVRLDFDVEIVAGGVE